MSVSALFSLSSNDLSSLINKSLSLKKEVTVSEWGIAYNTSIPEP